MGGLGGGLIGFVIGGDAKKVAHLIFCLYF